MKHKVQIWALIFTVFVDFLGFILEIAILPPVILNDHLHLLLVGMTIFSRNALLGY